VLTLIFCNNAEPPQDSIGNLLFNALKLKINHQSHPQANFCNVHSQSVFRDLAESLGFNSYEPSAATLFRERNGDGEVIVEITRSMENFLIHSTIFPGEKASYMQAVDLHRALTLNMHVDLLQGAWIGIEDKTNTLRLCAATSVRDAEVNALRAIVLRLVDLRKRIGTIIL